MHRLELAITICSEQSCRDAAISAFHLDKSADKWRTFGIEQGFLNVLAFPEQIRSLSFRDSTQQIFLPNLV